MFLFQWSCPNNTSVAQHFYPIKITTTWNAPNEIVSRRRVNSFKNSLDKHLAENPQIFELTDIAIIDAVHAQFKCAQTFVGQRFARNKPNGLFYYYYYYYYYYYHYYYYY